MGWLVRPTIEALGDQRFVPHTSGGEMKCPFCTQITPDSWQAQGYVPGAGKDFTSLTMEWMRCANEECQQAVVRLTETHSRGENVAGKLEMVTDHFTWLARPHGATRSIDPAIGQPFRRDYEEASAILDLSPRMSAVLSRKIVGDLLDEYAEQKQRRITQQIDGFNAITSHPRSIRENLHHLREIADFSAHTQRDERHEIVEASREEAEWTLDVVDRLFDYFIVTPNRDAAVRETFDAKIASIPGRKAITPLPDDPPES